MVEPVFDAIVTRSEASASIVIRGDIDVATVAHVELARDQALAGQPAELLIDLREVGFVDSSGLKLLLDTNGQAQREGWTLRLLRPGEAVMTVFVVTGADRHLPFVDQVGA
jgi:anti-sigma B factor antagonist